MKIPVGGKVFDITFVNNYCIERYNEMNEKVRSLPGLLDKLEVIKANAEKASDKKKYIAEIDAISEQMRELTKEVTLIREDILNELLVKNKYEYDKKWWLHETDANMLNEFISSSISKDIPKTRVSGKK